MATVVLDRPSVDLYWFFEMSIWAYITEIKIDFKTNWNFTACVAYKNQVRTEMEFSYSQTENFEMEKLSSDTGYFKKSVEIN